jgi:signal transduction histidine kinase
MFWRFLDDFNFIARCRKYRIGLWQCPNFLFLVMGFIAIAAMVATNYISKLYDNEAVAILSVSGVTALILIIGNFIIRGVEKIAEANIMKSEFISIISHQLCSPLSAIKWNVEVLETERKGEENMLTPKQTVFLENIKKSNERMLKLVNDLLEVIRIDQGRSVFARENVSLSQLALEVINELEYLSMAKKVKVNLKESSPLPRVYVDSKKMKVVMNNLIGNAVKYSEEGSEVDVKLELKGKKVLFAVEDHGAGIPRYQHDKVFEKFFRSNNSSKYRTEGVGLGLYLVKAIIRNFDGEVWFESEINKGSTFYVSLPATRG